MSPYPSRTRRRTALALLAAALIAIGGLTLLPAPGPAEAPRIVVLGSLSDLLRNVALYLPLGAALAGLGVHARAALSGAFALAAAIELAQLAIPGRAASPDDVLANLCGAWLGHRLVATAPRWLASPMPGRLELGAALAFAASVGAAAALTPPALPAGPWYAHWNPALGTLVPYPGAVLEARLGGRSLAHGAIPDAAAARRALHDGLPLEIRFRARPGGAGSLFLISDASERELAQLSLEGADVVLRYRSRARALGLEPAVLRGTGAGAFGPGEVAVLAVRREGPRVCIEREGRAGCGPGFTPASAWTLVLPVPAFPPGLLFAFDLAWLAALALPIGFFGRANPRPWLAPLGAATALALPPAFGWLVPAPPGQWIAAALGWGLGRALARARDDASRG